MHSGDQQTSLWEQSDLLDLVAAAASPTQPGVAAAAPRAEADGKEPGQPEGRSAAARREAVMEPEGVEQAAVAEAALPRAVVDADLGRPLVGGEPAASDQGPGFRQGGSHASEAEELPAAALSPHPPAAAAASPFEAVSPYGPPGEPRHPDARAAVAGDSQGHGVASADPPAASPATSEQEACSPPPGPVAMAAASCEAAPAAVARQEQAGGEERCPLPACPERLLILDTETTALSPQQGQCIEVGAVLFDVASRSVLMQVSFLLPCDHNPAQSVNGIPAAVSRLEQPWRSGLACFEAMLAAADAVLAHNAAFDRQWFGCGELPPLDKPWICSMEDIRWPADRQLRPTPSVRDLALAHGVPVWAAHRALTDCIYLVQVFQRCDELDRLLQTALEPRRLVRARLSYDQRQLAKDAGFRWNDPVPKAWSRRLSEREIAALPFAVDPLEADEPAEARQSQREQRWRRTA